MLALAVSGREPKCTVLGFGNRAVIVVSNAATITDELGPGIGRWRNLGVAVATWAGTVIILAAATRVVPARWIGSPMYVVCLAPWLGLAYSAAAVLLARAGRAAEIPRVLRLSMWLPNPSVRIVPLLTLFA